MDKKYKLTYTLYTELGKHTRVETFKHFETVLRVLSNLAKHTTIDHIKIKEIK